MIFACSLSQTAAESSKMAWRDDTVAKRLEYALVKVCTSCRVYRFLLYYRGVICRVV